jgi:hypothetical protein
MGMATAGLHGMAITVGITGGITIGTVARTITGIPAVTSVGIAVPIGTRDMAGTMDATTVPIGDGITIGIMSRTTIGMTELPRAVC